MGRQSAIGPTDPQFGGVAAGGVIEEFNQAVKETTDNPGSTAMWARSSESIRRHIWAIAKRRSRRRRRWSRNG